MADLGHFALLTGLFFSGYAVLVDILGAWRKERGLIESGRNATIACLGCLSIAMAALWVLLVKGDFSVNYVADHTARNLPVAYRISALWAGAAGSLLLWLWMQVGFITLAFCRFDANERQFAAVARSIANLVSVFFLVVLIMDKNPFALSVVAPFDGAGLNPLLQHPAMVFHPPTLFVGYAAFAIPFAWAVASLAGEGTVRISQLFNQARNWILWAWLFLTVGIVLGAWWAYEELGWGGYWAWDPVENSSLMPWLTATALLHCSRAYKPRSAIAVWLMILSIVTFSLCIFGTFLTRYGLVSSVHAFPEPGLGILFMVLLAVIWVIAAILLWRAQKRGKLSAEARAAQGQRFITLNNWLMVLLTFVIFVGTLFPFLSGLLSERKISLKPEYFTKITAPGGLALLLLLSICPHLLRYGINKSWRTIGMVVVAIIAPAVWLVSRTLAPVCLVLCGFAAVSLAVDFISRYLKRQGTDSKGSAQKLNLRWYGARIVHIGVVLAFIGIAGSGGYDVEKRAALRPGERMSVGGFDIIFESLRADHGPNFTAVTADVTVQRDGKLVDKLSPSRAYYSRSEKRTSEVDIRRTLGSDLYLALTEVDTGSQLINLTVLLKPLINWIWIGSTVSVLGVVIVLTSFYRQQLAMLFGENKDAQ
ncbi:MAG: heme lyase CcmF/NrfE family subunit [Planctomycetota bacterium]|jgi:cytochrome c-type biogenesis protein CcmF